MRSRRGSRDPRRDIAGHVPAPGPAAPHPGAKPRPRRASLLLDPAFAAFFWAKSAFAIAVWVYGIAAAIYVFGRTGWHWSSRSSTYSMWPRCRRTARTAGADEDLLAEVDRYESSERLTERQKVILRLADAHIFGSVPPTLPEQVARHLDPAEAIEVALLVSKYSFQKPLVALGLDARSEYDVIDFDPRTGEVIRYV